MAALARAASEPEEGTGFERGRGHEAPRESDGARRLGGQAWYVPTAICES